MKGSGLVIRSLLEAAIGIAFVVGILVYQAKTGASWVIYLGLPAVAVLLGWRARRLRVKTGAVNPTSSIRALRPIRFILIYGVLLFGGGLGAAMLFVVGAPRTLALAVLYVLMMVAAGALWGSAMLAFFWFVRRPLRDGAGKT